MKFIIVCDGGLGNRLNSLYSGLALCGYKDIRPIVYWPVNEYCSLSVEDSIDNIDFPRCSSLEELDCGEDVVNLSHDARKFSADYFINVGCAIKASDIHISKAKSYLYSAPLMPIFVRKKSLVKIRNKYPLTKKYEENIGLNKNTVGLHLRGTDYGFGKAYFFFFWLIVKFSPYVKYRLFTDDRWVLDLFGRLNNIAIESRIELPHKKDVAQDWSHNFNTEFAYNIVRNKESVKKAISEMYDLSQTFKLPTSRSTFLFHAYLIDNSSIGFHLCFYCNVSIGFFRLIKNKVKI